MTAPLDPALAALELPGLVLALSRLLRARGWQLATAESCTGGLIAAACTDLAGSSDWFERGFVTYSNAAKTELLGVSDKLIVQHGAVSQTVVRAMAAGALARSRAQICVAVTGVAGPGGGSIDKPVGTVWFGFALRASTTDGSLCKVAEVAEVQQFPGNRAAVRASTTHYALGRLILLVQGAGIAGQTDTPAGPP